MRTAAYFVGGLLVGAGATLFALEDRYRRKLEDAIESNKRVYEHFVEIHDGKTDEEAEVVEIKADDFRVADLQAAEPVLRTEQHNPYHKAVTAVGTPVDTFVSGGVNDYGVSYIEEEEFHDENGFDKGAISVVMEEVGEPVFFLNGVLIDDWDVRVGDSIVVDMLKLVPAGLDQVLYVRNHAREEDYEVMMERP